MTRVALLALLVAVGAALPAQAQFLADCRAIKDTAERLACFDKLATPTGPDGQPVSTAPSPPPAPAPAPVKPAEADPFGPPKVVDAADLSVGSKKYLGQLLELRNMRCYYADVSDYRCISGVNVVVFSKVIGPDDERKAIERDCDQIRKLASSACQKTIRFSFRENDIDDDTINGTQRRTVITPDDIEIVPAPAAARGRRRR